MANEVFVHVGAPLTGSAFVRETLARHRRRLTRAGVLYPQNHLGHDAGHLDAVLDVLALAATDRPASAGAWDRLAETARDWRRGTVVVSHELLAEATTAQIERMAGSLGNTELHVVYAVRDLGRQLPLAWQEWVDNGGTAPFARYAERVLARDERGAARVFWHSHDPARVLGRWSGVVPPERVHVVTVPQGGDRDAVVWRRFAETVGIDPLRFRAGEDRHRRLRPLATTEALRQINVALGEEIPPERAAVLLGHLDPGSGPVPHVPQAAAGDLAREAGRITGAIAAAGYDVVGDLADLHPEGGCLANEPRQVEPSAEAVIDVQSRALVGLAGLRGRARGPAGLRRRALRELSLRRPGRSGRRGPATP